MSACYWWHQHSDKCIYCGWKIGKTYPLSINWSIYDIKEIKG